METILRRAYTNYKRIMQSSMIIKRRIMKMKRIRIKETKIKLKILNQGNMMPTLSETGTGCIEMVNQRMARLRTRANL